MRATWSRSGRGKRDAAFFWMKLLHTHRLLPFLLHRSRRIPNACPWLVEPPSHWRQSSSLVDEYRGEASILPTVSAPETLNRIRGGCGPSREKYRCSGTEVFTLKPAQQNRLILCRFPPESAHRRIRIIFNYCKPLFVKGKKHMFVHTFIGFLNVLHRPYMHRVLYNRVSEQGGGKYLLLAVRL